MGGSRDAGVELKDCPRAKVEAGGATQAEMVPPKARSPEAQPRVPVTHHGKYVGETTVLP